MKKELMNEVITAKKAFEGLIPVIERLSEEAFEAGVLGYMLRDFVVEAGTPEGRLARLMVIRCADILDARTFHHVDEFDGFICKMPRTKDVFASRRRLDTRVRVKRIKMVDFGHPLEEGEPYESVFYYTSDVYIPLL